MKISEARKFALTLLLMPWIPAFIIYKHGHFEPALVVIGVFLFTSFVCFISQKVSLWLKETLSKIGKFLGKYLAIIALAFVYIFAVLPTGTLAKIIGRDRLRLKKQNLKTYWIDYKNENTDYEFQF
jgi:hypothetical protein